MNNNTGGISEACRLNEGNFIKAEELELNHRAIILKDTDGDNMQDGISQESYVLCNKIIRGNDMQHEIESFDIQQGNEEPCVGMEFDSHEDAYEFYNSYAIRVGFSTRIGRNYKSKIDGTLISLDIFCSREGFRRKSDKQSKQIREITRGGCKAMIRLKKRNNKWLITRFDKNHNHELADPFNVHLLRSHKKAQRRMGMSDIRMTSRMSGTSRVHFLTQLSNRVWNAGLIGKDGQSYIGQRKVGALGIDVHALLKYLKIMKAKNPLFFYALKVDGNDAVSDVFWVDPRCRSAYVHFGDVIILDTNYKKNQYHIPFVSITGVNHHRQSIPFGSALLSDESESTYIWLFESWLEAMNHKHPNLIVTDQDKTIKTVVAKVFRKSCHRFCRCNILRKMKEKLPQVIHEYEEFFQEVEDVVNNSDTVHGFEEDWKLLIRNYNLEENEWLQSLYNDRHYWVPSCFKDAFFSGLCTQEEERIKSLFDGYIHENVTPCDFIKHYEKALENQYEQEVLADFNSLDNRPAVKTPMPIVEQASKIYTRNIFCLFQEEMIQSLACSVEFVSKNGTMNTYMVKKYGPGHKEYAIAFNLDTRYGYCSCKKFDFDGVICRHILAVFRKLDINELSSYYIFKRWTKGAKMGYLHDNCSMEQFSEFDGTSSTQYNILCEEALRCCEEGACSIELYHIAMNGLREIRLKLLNSKQNASLFLPTSNQLQLGTTENNLLMN